MVSNWWITQRGNTEINKNYLAMKDGQERKKISPENLPSERKTLIWVLVFLIFFFIFWLLIKARDSLESKLLEEED